MRWVSHMKMKLERTPRILFWFALVWNLALAGCVSVHLIADYDAKLDAGVTELQRKTETFLVKLERAGPKPEGRYEANIAFYDEVKVDLSALQVRADSVALNKQTSEQLSLLRDSFNQMEKIHSEKGTLSPLVIAETRKQLNHQFTAILTLEVAKKDRLSSKE
jgi:hypothetical protein